LKGAGRATPNSTTSGAGRGMKRSASEDLSPRAGSAKRLNSGSYGEGLESLAPIAEYVSVGGDMGAVNVAIEDIQWVQCDAPTCGKWRKAPGHVDLTSLPEQWFCTMNNWDLSRASCDVPEDTATTPVYVMGGVDQSRNKITPKGNRSRTLSSSSSNNNAYNAPAPPPKTQWVQCENPHCGKWRKLPSHIDPENLPEKWYKESHLCMYFMKLEI
jgi:hypothetical protein